jgi:predicted MPP superfamily phosphohydrolase
LDGIATIEVCTKEGGRVGRPLFRNLRPATCGRIYELEKKHAIGNNRANAIKAWREKVKYKYAFAVVLLLVFLVPGIGQDQPFHFMILTDTQLGMYASNKDFVRETANYEFAVATVNRLKPRFVIILGDLINKEGDPEQLREFLRITGKIDPSIPVRLVPGNHDVGAAPTPELLAAYRKNIGRDYYSFRAGPVYGIVLNSVLIHNPQKAEDEYRKQTEWLKGELDTAKKSGAPQVIVFQHHPYFIKEAGEPDQYMNISLERRKPMLELLHAYNVRYVFAGHVHQNSVGRDEELEMTVTGPVAMPFGEGGSGIRLVEVTTSGARHQFFDFGKMPDALAIK